MLVHQRCRWVHQLLWNHVVLHVLLLLRLTDLLMQTCVGGLLHVLGELATHCLCQGWTHLRALRWRLYNVLDLRFGAELRLMASLLRTRTRDEIIRISGTLIRLRVFIEVSLSVLAAARHVWDRRLLLGSKVRLII